MIKALLILLVSVSLFVPVRAQVREVESPAGQASAQPNLTVSPDGRVYLSWIDRLGEGRFSLRFSTFDKDKWSPPSVIAEGAGWFVNWADFPSMVVLPDGSLAAHWLVKSGPDTYAYDVTISRSFGMSSKRERDSTASFTPYSSAFGASSSSAVMARW